MSKHPDNATRGVLPDPDTGPLLGWGAIGILITVLTIILCVVVFRLRLQSETLHKVLSEESEAVRFQRQQLDQLESSSLEGEGRHIAIEHAMDLIVQEQGS